MAELMPLFQAIVAIMAVLSFLLLGFNALLAPLRKNQDRMESRIDHLDNRMDRLEHDIAEIKRAVLKKA